jgi:hypothetical protein
VRVSPVAIMNTQFVQLTLPLMLIVALDAWVKKRKYKDLLRRIDGVIQDLDHKPMLPLLRSGSR